MLLSQTAEYALRAAIVLARSEPGAFVDSREISALANIPPAYALKILRRLTAAKVVVARRGVGGGYKLADAPGSVRFYDVIAAVEPLDVGPQPCAFGHPACDEDRPCPMHDAFVALRGCFRRWAEHATLADLGHDVGRMLGSKGA